ncbi:MAG: hypothetical protein Q4D05_03970 [Acinetobacter sp.]|nr:hypothetical protein [Acinetobacter sp.]
MEQYNPTHKLNIAMIGLNDDEQLRIVQGFARLNIAVTLQSHAIFKDVDECLTQREQGEYWHLYCVAAQQAHAALNHLPCLIFAHDFTQEQDKNQLFTTLDHACLCTWQRWQDDVYFADYLRLYLQYQQLKQQVATLTQHYATQIATSPTTAMAIIEQGFYIQANAAYAQLFQQPVADFRYRPVLDDWATSSNSHDMVKLLHHLQQQQPLFAQQQLQLNDGRTVQLQFFKQAHSLQYSVYAMPIATAHTPTNSQASNPSVNDFTLSPMPSATQQQQNVHDFFADETLRLSPQQAQHHTTSLHRDESMDFNDNFDDFILADDFVLEQTANTVQVTDALTWSSPSSSLSSSLSSSSPVQASAWGDLSVQALYDKQQANITLYMCYDERLHLSHDVSHFLSHLASAWQKLQQSTAACKLLLNLDIGDSQSSVVQSQIQQYIQQWQSSKTTDFPLIFILNHVEQLNDAIIQQLQAWSQQGIALAIQHTQAGQCSAIAYRYVLCAYADIVQNIDNNAQQILHPYKQQGVEIILTGVDDMHAFAESWPLPHRYVLGDYYQTKTTELMP